MKRHAGIEVSRDGLWAMLTDARGILFRAAAEWDDAVGAAVFRFRDERGNRLLPRDLTVKEARTLARQFKRPEQLTDEDYLR